MAYTEKKQFTEDDIKLRITLNPISLTINKK